MNEHHFVPFLSLGSQEQGPWNKTNDSGVECALEKIILSLRHNRKF